MTSETKIPVNVCKRRNCRHIWQPRTLIKSLVCPRCKSPNWANGDIYREREKPSSGRVYTNA